MFVIRQHFQPHKNIDATTDIDRSVLYFIFGKYSQS